MQSVNSINQGNNEDEPFKTAIQDGHFIHANIDWDIIITKEPEINDILRK